MAKKERFFEEEIDRTPYSGCAWVGAIVGIVFLAGVTGLWKTSGYLKSHHMLQLSLPSFSTSEANENLIDKVKDASLPATPDLQKAQDEAKQKAQDALKAEAQRQIQEQLDKAKDQVSQ